MSQPPRRDAIPLLTEKELSWGTRPARTQSEAVVGTSPSLLCKPPALSTEEMGLRLTVSRGFSLEKIPTSAKPTLGMTVNINFPFL